MPYNSKTRYLRRLDKPLIVVLIIYLGFSFFMLEKFPKVWTDEAWSAMAPYNLVTEGKLANPIAKGRSDGLSEHVLFPLIVHRILLASVYKIFGFGLLQSRLLSVFAGFFLIVITYYFTKKYYDHNIAILAIIILASDNLFFVTARTVRPDIFVTLLVTSAVFLFLNGLETDDLKYFGLSGIAMGISLYTHPNSFLILITIVIIFLHRYKLEIILSKKFWIFVICSLIAFSPYAIYVIKEDYSNNFTDFFAQLGSNADFHNRNLLDNFLNEYKRYINYIFFPKRLLICVIQIIGLIYAIKSKRTIDRYFVLIIVLFVFLLPFWNPADPTTRYIMVLIPFMSILIAKLIIDFIRKLNFENLKTGKNLRYYISCTIFMIFFLNQVGGDAYILWKHRKHNYYSFIQEIQNTIPEGLKIWGPNAFWFGLYKFPYASQLTSPNEIDKFRPKYAILYDSYLWGGVSPTVGHEGNLPGYLPIRTKMEKLSRIRGTFIKKIENKYYGNIEIYKLNWNK